MWPCRGYTHAKAVAALARGLREEGGGRRSKKQRKRFNWREPVKWCSAEQSHFVFLVFFHVWCIKSFWGRHHHHHHQNRTDTRLFGKLKWALIAKQENPSSNLTNLGFYCSPWLKIVLLQLGYQLQIGHKPECLLLMSDFKFMTNFEFLIKTCMFCLTFVKPRNRLVWYFLRFGVFQDF